MIDVTGMRKHLIAVRVTEGASSQAGRLASLAIEQLQNLQKPELAHVRKRLFILAMKTKEQLLSLGTIE